MFGVIGDLCDDVGKIIAITIGTFIMTAVMMGLPTLAVLSFIFNWLGLIKIVTTLVSLVMFTLLWSSLIDGCSD